MGVAGNHEIEQDAQHNRFQAFETRYRYPFEESGSDSPQYYSFDAAGARPETRRATGECCAVLRRGAHDRQGKWAGAKLRVGGKNSNVQPMRYARDDTLCRAADTMTAAKAARTLTHAMFCWLCVTGTCRPARMRIARASPRLLASANDVASRLFAPPVVGQKTIPCCPARRRALGHDGLVRAVRRGQRAGGLAARGLGRREPRAHTLGYRRHALALVRPCPSLRPSRTKCVRLAPGVCGCHPCEVGDGACGLVDGTDKKLVKHALAHAPAGLPCAARSREGASCLACGLCFGCRRACLARW